MHFIKLSCCGVAIHGACLQKCIKEEHSLAVVRCPFCRCFLCLVPHFIPSECVEEELCGKVIHLSDEDYEEWVGSIEKVMKEVEEVALYLEEQLDLHFKKEHWFKAHATREKFGLV